MLGSVVAVAAMAIALEPSPPTKNQWAALRPLSPAEEGLDGWLSLEEEGIIIEDDNAEAVSLRKKVEANKAHGTTTVALIVEEGVVVCVDSRASMGNLVGSSETQKLLPISKTVVATMAGSAADCAHFIRYVSARAKLYELTEGRPLTTRHASRILAATLRRTGGDLSIGTMVVGIDDGVPLLCYVDSDGARVEGHVFAVGSGSPWAYSVLDAGYRKTLSKTDACALAVKAVTTATERDAFSGGVVNLFFVDRHTGEWAKIIDHVI